MHAPLLAALHWTYAFSGYAELPQEILLNFVGMGWFVSFRSSVAAAAPFPAATRGGVEWSAQTILGPACVRVRRAHDTRSV
jgi:drug/metabolite transporter (DMT)-like permease